MNRTSTPADSSSASQDGDHDHPHPNPARARCPGLGSLSAEQVAFYDREGYLVLERLLAGNDMLPFRESVNLRVNEMVLRRFGVALRFAVSVSKAQRGLPQRLFPFVKS